MTTTTGSPAWPTRIAIGLCLLAAMIEGFDIASMGVAAPTMMPSLGLSKPEAGWAFSASLLGLMFGAAFAGTLSDRIGRKPVLLASVTVFGLFTLGTAMAHGYAPLLIVRFLTGLGLGGAMPMLIAMASELASPKRKTFVVSSITAGLPMGGALVGLLARTDLAAADWRLIFLVGGALPLMLVIALWVWLPETGTRPQAPARGAGVAALFGKGRLGTTMSLWVSYAAIALVLHLFLNWLPSLMVARGVEGKAAAGISTLFNLGGAAGGVLVGLTIDRLGARWPLAAAVAGLVAVLFALAAPGAGLPVTAALAFGAGFLIMATQFGLYGVGPQYYALPVRGTGVGAAIAAGRFGSVLGPVLAGQLLGGGASAGQVVLSTVPIVLLAGAAAMALTVVGKRAEGTE
ncbi:MAG: MFS transporter [Caulobacter sp.]|nr:MFS transporter [Caulobacter sp.]